MLELALVQFGAISLDGGKLSERPAMSIGRLPNSG